MTSNKIRLFIWVLLIFTLTSSLHAENPFGGSDSEPPPPPASGPIDENDYPGGESFGFTPPPVDAPPSTPEAPVTTLPGAGSRQSSTPPSKSTPTNNSTSLGTGMKPPPALAEYLSLDNSVKGLQVKNFDLPDKDIKDVVTLISKWTGKNFILDSKVRGKITIIGPSQVTLQEAYQAFLSALDANGLTTVQSGKFVRIIESQEARRAPVQTFAGEFAPNDDQFITRIFQLKYINSDEVQREFRDLTTRQGKLFAYEPTNSLIITDTGSNIQRIREILDSLDVKNFETTLHVLRVKNNSAKIISEMLGEIYGDDKKGGGTNRSFRRSALERTRGGGIITKIIPDEATNSLIVLANRSGYLTLVDLVAKLDIRIADTGRIHVYYCEHAKAEDLAATLGSLSGGGGGRSKKSAPAAGGAPAAGPSGPVSAELDGGIKITSDSATNALVITANSSDYQTIKRVIKRLDIPRLQVFIQTAIMEVSLDDNDKWGLNYLFGVPGRIGPAFISSADDVKNALTNGPPGEGLSFPVAAAPEFPTDINVGGTKFTVPIPSFAAIMSIVAKSTDTSILSTPQIIALDNEKAVFKVQDDVPVFSSSTGATATAAATQNIERLKTGIEMIITPHINAASRIIRLEIEQTVESTKGSTGVPAELANKNVAKTTRITNTQVVVKDSDFVMLGGLISDKIDDQIIKVPLLGDIPILGWLFKARNYKAVKTNLIILLHPKIIGTGITSANLIEEQLKKRDVFIDKNISGSDIHKEYVDDLKKLLGEQAERGKLDPDFDYRNTQEGEEDPSDNKDLESLSKAYQRSREKSNKAATVIPNPDTNPNPNLKSPTPPDDLVPLGGDNGGDSAPPIIPEPAVEIGE